ncbi:MAG TPA: LysR family transcriptional regulator [Lachnospiraceae bacterium]|nr:LysR family transcriptional regulator [Lachnospiraceae bacterium]
MDIRQIKYFLTVSEELNITRAAEKLHLSQPPLSRALMELEEELGCKLMTRGKRHITLTQEGLALKIKGKQIIELTEMTKAEISEMKNGISGTIYLGHVDSNGPTLAAQWIESFKKEYPNVMYNLWCGTVDDLTDRMKAGLIDIAVTMTPLNSELLEGFKVYKENWVAIIPTSHPIAKTSTDTVSLEELSGNDLIISSRRTRENEIRSWFEGIKKEPKFTVKIAHSSNVAKLVSRGIGIGIFPASVAKNIPQGSDVVIKEIRPVVSVEYMLSWDKNHAPNILAGKFIEHVKSLIK